MKPQQSNRPGVSRAVVTGARGFLGRHVARCLARRGYVVTGLGHGNWQREEWRLWGLSEWHQCDITIDSLMAFADSPSVLIHCAGSGSVPFSLLEPLTDLNRTVLTTAAAIEYIRAASPDTRFVYPSSAGVYGAAKEFPIREDCPLAPISPYGTHKRMAEDLVGSYSRNFGLKTAIIRFFSLYGSGLRKQFLWDACGKLSRKDFRFMGTGEELRDWLFIDDAAALVAAAVDKADQSSPVVNGGTGIGTPVRELVEHLAQCLQFDSAELQFTGEVRAGDPSRYVADIERARGWNWEPSKHWKDRVEEYADWWVREMGLRQGLGRYSASELSFSDEERRPK